jgi:hypothetical protein
MQYYKGNSLRTNDEAVSIKNTKPVALKIIVYPFAVLAWSIHYLIYKSLERED